MGVGLSMLRGPIMKMVWENLSKDYSRVICTCLFAASFAGPLIASGFAIALNWDKKINASYVKGTWDRFRQKEYTDHTYMTFGHGDGGGGPTKLMLETQRRTASLISFFLTNGHR